MRRRQYLALLGTVTVGGFAGCSSGNGGGDGTTTGTGTDTTSTSTTTETTGSESTTATTTRTETRTETRTATGTGTPTSTASATETTGETTTGSSDETTDGSSGGSSADARTVEVGPGNQYVFEPGTSSPLEIPVGTTVEWVWRSDTHNIVVGEQPSGANWEGTPGGANGIYNSGYTYTHTFETEGEYHYYCSPHQSLGMVADVVVTGSR